MPLQPVHCVGSVAGCGSFLRPTRGILSIPYLASNKEFPSSQDGEIPQVKNNQKQWQKLSNWARGISQQVLMQSKPQRVNSKSIPQNSEHVCDWKLKKIKWLSLYWRIVTPSLNDTKIWISVAMVSRKMALCLSNAERDLSSSLKPRNSMIGTLEVIKIKNFCSIKVY